MREPVQIVELWQPRCSHRFGVAPCTASIGDGPRCYNCWGTCLDRANYLGDGSIAWRFCAPVQAMVPLYEREGDHVRTNALPLLKSVSARSSKINVGSIRDGEKPLGVTGAVSVQLSDAVFDDHVGDWYRAERGPRPGNFWAKWVARNPFYANMLIRVYDGYSGQSLAEMEQRLYVMDGIDGPDSDGSVTLHGVDPLRLTDATRSQFPRATDMRLSGDVDAVQTEIVIEASQEIDLSDQFGNTVTSYLCIGSEIIAYAGYSGADGVWTLSGVERGVLGTEADSHSAASSAQRVGRYDLMDAWEIANDLLDGHTPVPSWALDLSQWSAEAGVYLQGYAFSRTVHQPTAVNALLGELMRDGTFYIWWDERRQTIPLKAIRPEYASASVGDNADIVAGSIRQTREPDERISRVFIYFGQIDPTKGDDPENFTEMRGRIEGDFENELGGADVRTKTIYSKWITSEAQALELSQRLLARFKSVPRYLTVTMIDGTLEIGQVIDLTTRVDINTEGTPVTRRWQVIARQQIRAGETVSYQLQEFIYQAARYAVWMADDAPDYLAASEGERMKGFWWSDEDGLMSDGSKGWLWQ